MSDSKTTVIFEAMLNNRMIDRDAGLEILRERIGKRRTDEDTGVQIYQIVTTRSLLETVVIPAYVPPPMTLQEIVDYAADSSYGSRSGLDWPEQYESLTEVEKAQAEELIWEQISHCNDCGSVFPHEDLTYGDGEELCSSCESQRQEEEENDDDDE